MRHAALLIAIATAALIASCDDTPDSTLPVVRALSSPALAQDAILTLTGSGFGDYEAGSSRVFVNGVCAEIGAWQDDRVRIRVPSGVGLGQKVVVVQNAAGLRAHTTVTLIGQERVAQLPPSCEAGLVGGGVPGDASTGTPDVSEDTAVDPPDTDPVVDTAEDTSEDTGLPVDGWRYVAIRDESMNDIGRNPGADIDAVLLTKPDGTVYPASSVAFVIPGSLEVELSDPSATLGFPDAFPNFPDLSVCDVSTGTFALGGDGAILLGFAVPIQSGDVLSVYERGDCDFGSDEFLALAEDFSVSLTNEALPSGGVLGRGRGPVANFTIP